MLMLACQLRLTDDLFRLNAYSSTCFYEQQTGVHGAIRLLCECASSPQRETGLLPV